MKNHQLQSSFNNGVLDPTLRARFDIKQFYQGVEQGDNVKFLPQGGARRRPGLLYVDTLPGVSRAIPFIFNTDQKYCLVFSNNQIDVYRNDAKVDTVVTAYQEADLFDIDYAQSTDSMVLVHEDYPPRLLARGATDADFTITDIGFTELPQYDFADADSPTAADEVQDVTITSGVAGRIFKLNLEGIDTETITYQDNADGALNIQEALLDLINTPDTGITVARTGAGVFRVTFSGTAADDWRLLDGRFTDGGAGTFSVSRISTGSPQTEDVWSTGRGYPRTVTFHEARLWFGGSKQRPNTCWGSNVNSFFNYRPGNGRDDQAVEYTLDTDQINKIEAIFSSRTLQVFTAGGEFIVVQNEFDPITPSNIRILGQTRYGAKKIKPVDIEGVVTFVQRTGKAIREMFSESQSLSQSYSSPSISYLAPSLIVDPVQLEALRGTSSEDANYIIVVNSDGTVAIFNTLRDQNVSAWSRWLLSGSSASFRSVAVLLEDAYYITERRINGTTARFLERTDTSLYTDATEVYTGFSGSVLTGLSHLEGEAVSIRADGVLLPEMTVSAGQVTLTRTLTNARVEVGLNFTSTLKTMPVSQDAGAGFNLDDEKRITRVTLDLFETLGVSINGVPVPDIQFPLTLDTAPTPYTGRKGSPLLGWSKTSQVTITQDQPAPMTVLGIGIEVDG
ncbi:hypothetical protein [uncultured Paraglaciecola sp.]|mgnify:CR=1 FL=1|uniref:phage nozzle protein n=1 Tax=uncultured Paraglaciecola sp. TaxID=1765024 RepID=UPI002614943B|nr:hypothetical protein [uncultured Paraglaciecola sp.]